MLKYEITTLSSKVSVEIEKSIQNFNYYPPPQQKTIDIIARTFRKIRKQELYESIIINGLYFKSYFNYYENTTFIFNEIERIKNYWPRLTTVG